MDITRLSMSRYRSVPKRKRGAAVIRGLLIRIIIGGEEVVEFLNTFPREAQKAILDAPKTAARNDTTYVATADKFGNWASLIQSVHHSFGCGIVVEGTGIVLNNRMSGFNLISGHANELAPAKLPAHTLSPALVLKDNVPVLAIGTPGGLGQTPVSRPDPVQSF